MLFLRDIVWVYGTVPTVYENFIVTEVAAVSERELQLKDGPLSLSVFAQCHADLLK